jgi:hypothetical protein
MEPVNITEPAILLCINRLFRSGMSGPHLYDITRGVWAARSEQRSRVQLAFAVFHGRIVEVYQIQKWHRAGTTPYASRRQIDLAAHANDWEFTGAPAPSEIRDKYVDQRAPRFWGNPIRYLNT